MQLLEIVRFVEGLCSQAHMLGNILTWFAFDPGSFDPQSLPQLIHPPQNRRQPTHSCFDQNNFETGETFKNALKNQAGKMRLETAENVSLVLDIVGGIAPRS